MDRSSFSTWIAAIVACFALVAATSEASAQNVAGVEKFDGRKEKKVRAAVHKVLKKKKITYISAKKIKRTANGSSADMEDSDDRRKVAETLGISVFVFGTVAKEKRHWVAFLAVENADTGDLIAEVEFKHKRYNRMVKNVRRQFWKKLGEAIKSGNVPVTVVAPVEPKVAATVETIEDEPEEPSKPGLMPLSLTAGTVILNRTLSYSDDVSEELRPYELGLGPAVNIGLQWYPGAHFTDGFASNIGLVGQFTRSLGLNSKTSEGGEFPTTSTDYEFGLKYRLPIGSFEGGLAFIYGHHDFLIEDDGDTPKPMIPSVAYDWIGPDLSGKYGITDEIAVWGHARYMVVTGLGEIGEDSFFPNATAGGLALGVGGGYAFIPSLEVGLTLDYRRYFFDFAPDANAELVAGGAVDSYVGGLIGLSYRMQ